ncbi:hypothetical protein BABINDRAFT_126914 [Babjeviella inositovora NRRL Y-12698]|uniref:C2H2-type domain-containing protein n=1 Tax=Babjeviella inositovora NRRL Y-12698 TaxID=984486 RepID=A0A1E3QSS3_9ASCO|nr:uncharacterized protein BABINDRAFT_126914 [Babjeviella inositovora NRRL Y-12698]ODQ80763.1 hypothetical protein BABINDRAFT_126914 [Babjeviella inositovora NRRL Y-12698]
MYAYPTLGRATSTTSANSQANDPAHQQTGVYYAAPAAHDSQIWKRTSNGYVVPLHPQAKVGKDTGKSRKRFRRKFSEIDRIFRCTHTGCDKAYGKLNHLNTHIISQKHGEKKTTEEYRELLRLARGSHNARDDDHDSEGLGLGRRTLDQTELKYNSVRPYDPTVNYTTGPQGYPPVAGAGFDPAGYNGYYPNGAPYGAFPQGFAPAPQPPANPLQHAQFLPYGAAGYPQPYRGEEKVSILNDDKDAGTVQ